MGVRRIAADLILPTNASDLATKAMEPVSTKLYEWESAANRAREAAARPGPPYRIAAEKTARLVGLELSEAAMGKASLAFTMAWPLPGAVHPGLRTTGLSNDLTTQPIGATRDNNVEHPDGEVRPSAMPASLGRPLQWTHPLNRCPSVDRG